MGRSSKKWWKKIEEDRKMENNMQKEIKTLARTHKKLLQLNTKTKIRRNPLHKMDFIRKQVSLYIGLLGGR